MYYLYSQIDRDNLKWFEKDGQSRTLKSIILKRGKIRGLCSCSIEFKYPIAAIAGKNGAGKSTILALACCAYHNEKDGYIPVERNKTYYTFRDFFIGTSDEEKVEDIEIEYKILVKVKRVTKDIMMKTISEERLTKLRTQVRKKRKGGRWNDYEQRTNRNVIFSGIQRIVPPSERKTDRSYSARFESTNLDTDTKDRILEIASKVLGKKYNSLDLRTVDKRRLFVVDRMSSHYSGFNMGAGENAIFSVLIELFMAKRGTLLVIDEIELGLHEEAQRRFISELKKICKERKCQVICSTHSAAILDSLPPEGRFFVESYDNKTDVINGISSEYATGKLAGEKTEELTVFVEDEIGQAIVFNALTANIKKRINILPIGSDQAVLMQLAARYREQKYNCIAFLDGDKKASNKQSVRQVKKHLEDRFDCSKEEMEQWIIKRLKYLPGSTWPENWLIQHASDHISKKLSKLWRISEEDILQGCDKAIMAGKHNEFYEISQTVPERSNQIISDIVRNLVEVIPKEFLYIEEEIKNMLE